MVIQTENKLNGWLKLMVSCTHNQIFSHENPSTTKQQKQTSFFTKKQIMNKYFCNDLMTFLGIAV